jgi:hypothetical protein
VRAFKEDREEEIRKLVARQRAGNSLEVGGGKEEEEEEEEGEGEGGNSLVEAWSLAQLAEEGVERIREGGERAGERLREGGQRLRTHISGRVNGSASKGNARSSRTSPIKTRGDNQSDVKPGVLFTRATLVPNRTGGAATGGYARRAKKAAAYKAVAKPTPAKGLRKKGTRVETR